jgi:DNA-binding HxlR family transcriptional regulator
MSMTNPLAMRVIARLRRGPGRFNQLERDTAAPSPFAMSSVLKKLCRDGLILRTVLRAEPPAHCEYTLTVLGRDYAESADQIEQHRDNYHAAVEALGR